MRFPTLLPLFVVFLAPLAARAQAPQYPPAAKSDHSDDYHGVAVADPYRWMEDADAPATKTWVAAENRVTADYFGKIPYRDAVLARLQTLVNYPRYSAPFKKNGFVYFYRNSGLQNQSELCMQKGYDGTPETLINPNTFSQDGTIRLTAFGLSKNGRYAVVGRTAIAGSDWESFQIMDMTTRKYLPETLRWIKFGGAAWRGDGFYYTRYAQPEPGQELTAKAEFPRVYFHKLNTSQDADALVYEDKAHADRRVSLSTTEDERFALLYLGQNSKRGNAVSFRDETKGETAFTPLVKEIGEDRYGVVDDDGDGFLLETNHGAPNEKVVRCDLQHPAQSDWTAILPERPEPLSGISTAGGKLIASYLKDVTTRVSVFDRTGKLESEATLPGVGTASGFGGEKTDTEVFYSFTAMNIPPSLYRYDLASRQSTLFRAPQVPGFDPANYESKQVFYTSKDGTRVPMFLLYKKGIKRDGTNPTLLYGYGGFNISLTPGFSASRIAWVEQGGIYAVANLRGGAEYGEKWHEAGYRLRKQNVFDDCIAAGEYLVAQHYTTPAKLALNGGSNGGLLVGAVINQRPDLFRAAVPEVGVMDMLRFQKFSAGVFWVSDYGSSDDAAQFAYLYKYSPLHNIKTGARYPAVLVTTSDHDDRVVPMHSFKYTATLQEKASRERPVLIRIETNSGHGASNLTKSLAETADVYSFLFYNLGVTPRYP